MTGLTKRTFMALNLVTSLLANCFKTCRVARPKETKPWRMGVENPEGKREQVYRSEEETVAKATP